MFDFLKRLKGKKESGKPAKDLTKDLELLEHTRGTPDQILNQLKKNPQAMDLLKIAMDRMKKEGVDFNNTEVVKDWIKKHKEELSQEYQREVPRVTTFVHKEPQVGRNDSCPCGSGKKYKKCCLPKTA